MNKIITSLLILDLCSGFLLFQKLQTRLKLFEYKDEDGDEGVYGAKFFGGTVIKEALFDPQIEEAAIIKDSQVESFDRFLLIPREVRDVARELQAQLNGLQEPTNLYSRNLEWKTALDVSERNPLEEIIKAKSFFRKVHVSILDGRMIHNKEMDLRWEVCVMWPTSWDARVLITGTSKLTLDNNNQIIKQCDTLDTSLFEIWKQIIPRFWDTYHLLMSPSAQLQPRFYQKTRIFEIPPQLQLVTSLQDTNNRLDRCAQSLPNEVFTTIIKTTGKKKQTYVPSSPVEIQIDSSFVVWYISVPTEITTQPLVKETTCSYELRQRRLVATLPFGGSPQDEGVPQIRKQLFQLITSQGYQPKTNQQGKPVFFFFLNDCKACFTQQGLGMAIYDWRPEFARCNEVGIELEID